MTRRLTVYDLKSLKGRRKWLQLHVDTPAEAAAAVACDIAILSCEPDHNLEAIRAMAPHAFVSVGMPHGAVASPDEAVRLGFAIMRRGADAVYCSHSPRFIEAMAAEGIPVTGHVGLVPNLATWTNFRAIGKTAEEALRVLRAVKDLENAGAACVEVEVVPVRLADHITSATPMITMGMGCGSACDTQYLFSSDVLGTHSGHYPRHSRRYADFIALEAELQSKRIAAFRAFAGEVADGSYPAAEHRVDMDDAAFDRLLTLSQSL
ncbi:3-methyl-2-oxobutanoate hydroxymethyltransferase [Mesorhizobium sp. PAMC28654]|uniref:3-methyl-2-oxobutanoate hydroxymethyltransferase n=1 Tax=Mesorhizobium sp. PAMC28654 TaxID=2880934 RepID=UPI001D09CA09|nr:3-methyl-2-oxobutanoate hydroxymethyltransferase [Mesorhizobium sp. PAMC28654]UDL89399.1 3-methyl-2-oxobutanoate hydroxymethyltransferase [Mesorhizobium sp. PAMC28654]